MSDATTTAEQVADVLAWVERVACVPADGTMRERALSFLAAMQFYPSHAPATLRALLAEREALRANAVRWQMMRELLDRVKWADLPPSVAMQRPDGEKYVTAASLDAAMDAIDRHRGADPTASSVMP